MERIEQLIRQRTWANGRLIRYDSKFYKDAPRPDDH
jgi:hypothetical protein